MICLIKIYSFKKNIKILEIQLQERGMTTILALLLVFFQIFIALNVIVSIKACST